MKGKVKKGYEEWFFQVDYDLKTAEALFKSGRYIYALFMCHLCVEKALKGLIVKRRKSNPPKTHNITYLIDEYNIEVPEEYSKLVFKINELSVPTRYPEDLEQELKSYNKAETKEILKQTKKLVLWLKQQ